jgi:hypothetical protein
LRLRPASRALRRRRGSAAERESPVSTGRVLHFGRATR